MAGSRRIQRCHLVLVLAAALVSLSTVAAAAAGLHGEARKDYLEWIEGRVQDYEASTQFAEGLAANSFPKSTGRTVAITVNREKGKGQFRKVQKAIDSIPDGSTTRYLILVGPGTYKERINISSKKGPITLQGAGMRVTKITYDLDNTKAGGTTASASVSVASEHFIAKDIAFENSSPSPPSGAVGKQAVAFMIEGDKGAFWRVAFLGYQDTLYDKEGRHYFKDCYIRGTIDFIFGNGKSYYETCYLDSVATSFGSLTAQKRETNNDASGYSFVNCIVNGTGYSYLGRAWGNSSRAVFIQTYLGAAIRPEGWNDWGMPARDKTVFYGEYKCYGPGSNRAGRVPWSLALTHKQVKPFLTIAWIQGSTWLPKEPQ